ncbi:MAG: hypothetical protein ACR2J8_02935 [Thermomicrobiales bacterium]
MDGSRFDRLTRTLGEGRTRRAVMRSAVAAGLLGRVAAPAPAEARKQNYCSWEGCACQQGQFDATGCNEGLTCCIGDGTLSIGTGVCTNHCGIQCIAPGNPCNEGCPWYGDCYGCCSSHCENGYCTWA